MSENTGPYSWQQSWLLIELDVNSSLKNGRVDIFLLCCPDELADKGSWPNTTIGRSGYRPGFIPDCTSPKITFTNNTTGITFPVGVAGDTVDCIADWLVAMYRFVGADRITHQWAKQGQSIDNVVLCMRKIIEDTLGLTGSMMAPTKLLQGESFFAGRTRTELRLLYESLQHAKQRGRFKGNTLIDDLAAGNRPIVQLFDQTGSCVGAPVVMDTAHSNGWSSAASTVNQYFSLPTPISDALKASKIGKEKTFGKASPSPEKKLQPDPPKKRKFNL